MTIETRKEVCNQLHSKSLMKIGVYKNTDIAFQISSNMPKVLFMLMKTIIPIRKWK